MSCKNGKPDHLGHRFRVIHNMIDKYFQKNREAGRACNLTRAQCGAIHYFYDHREEDIFQKDFEAEFSISGATATNILKVLEREKLIERIPMKVILKCVQLIQEDKVSIGVFPEGYTSKDGKLHPFRSGAFKIAQKTQVPIVVCTIQNTRDIFKNLAHFRHTDVELHLVEVIPPEAYQGMTTVELSNLVYEKMIADLGERFRYTEV